MGEQEAEGSIKELESHNGSHNGPRQQQKQIKGMGGGRQEGQLS